MDELLGCNAGGEHSKQKTGNDFSEKHPFCLGGCKVTKEFSTYRNQPLAKKIKNRPGASSVYYIIC